MDSLPTQSVWARLTQAALLKVWVLQLFMFINLLSHFHHSLIKTSFTIKWPTISWFIVIVLNCFWNQDTSSHQRCRSRGLCWDFLFSISLRSVCFHQLKRSSIVSAFLFRADILCTIRDSNVTVCAFWQRSHCLVKSTWINRLKMPSLGWRRWRLWWSKQKRITRGSSLN